MTDTRIVCGFLGAGKTSWILDCLRNDPFYKYGNTLILCFEQGETGYDTDLLSEKNTRIAYYDGEQDVSDFCTETIESIRPDRIYVEMNTMMQGLREKLPAVMQVTFSIMLIDWATMGSYYVNFRQMIFEMVSNSQQVVFRGCPSRELLAPYSEAFQLMNRTASYLRQDPMGFHERAFDLFLPYSLAEEAVTIDRRQYLPFWLDAREHPEHYEGKKLCFTEPLELRRTEKSGLWSAGRVVMTCCMADLQFMAIELTANGSESLQGGWIVFEALAKTETDEYGRRALKLKPLTIRPASAPPDAVLTPSDPFAEKTH